MHPFLDKAAKRRLRALRRTLDPVVLLAEVRKAQSDLGMQVDRRPGSAPARALSRTEETAAEFAEGLAKGWECGERRAIHRRRYIRRKPAPRRPSMIEPHVSDVETWLAAEPHLTAIEVLGRLTELAPGRFGGKQLRTVQRLVRAWRSRMARLLIEGAEGMIMIEASAATRSLGNILR